jgi:pyruvate kinase
MICNGDRCVYGQTNIILTNHMEKLAKFEDTHNKFAKKTQIVCTIGPSCWSVERLVEMIDEGMSVARLNFSHGDHEVHGATVARIREACKLRPGSHVAIMLDTKGPEIRTGFLEEGKAIDLVGGSDLILITDYSFKGNPTKIAVSYPLLTKSVKVGGKILMADGSIVLEVAEIGDDWVRTKVLNSGKLGERKNMNLPGCKVELPVIGEKDKNDLINFAIPQGVNFVAASFVQKADDVREIRQILGPRGRHIKIISKIENQAGLQNFDEILAESDSIMVARGDLGMEIPPEKVFLAQKMMISKCNIAGKPVITATQMLESMVKNPRPTRAEASDVANAVLDGTDCVMLSGETAGGDFPIHSVHIMRRICEEAESVIDYYSLFNSIRDGVMATTRALNIPESVCSSAVKAATDANCQLIIALTETGSTARLLAKYRPSQPILALSAAESTSRHLKICRGVISLQVPSFQGTEHVIRSAIEHAKELGLVKAGDRVVVVHGVQEDVSGHSNLMKILDVV